MGSQFHYTTIAEANENEIEIVAISSANALLHHTVGKTRMGFDTRSVAARPRLRVESLRNFYIQNIVFIF